MQTINGYTLDENKWKLIGGNGQCNVATKNGKRYFIKKLISIKYPVSNMLSREVKEQQIRECAVWLKRRNDVLRALPGTGTGNIIKPVEYFRDGAFFYEVANMVEIEPISFEEICQKTTEEKKLIMLTIATSMADIHKAGVVHGDLDPGNILISRSTAGKLIAKIIDFTDAFMADNPPESIMSKEYWWSPEVSQYAISDEKPNPWRKYISCKADVFSLGIIFHQYCSRGGKGPGCSGDYPWQDFFRKKKLNIDRNIEPEFCRIIEDMLKLEPDERISMEEVCRRLKGKSIPDNGTKPTHDETRPTYKDNQYESGPGLVERKYRVVSIEILNTIKVRLTLENGKTQIMDIRLALSQDYIRPKKY